VTARSLAWLGVKTARSAEMAAFYRDVLGLEVLRDEPGDARFRLGDGTEVHVYGDEDDDHAFFGPGPVVAFWVDDFAVTRVRMEEAGIRFIGPVQREGDTVWNHFEGPDGNIYEIMGRG
jgi:catechol 2,3-dioxygenase-like lactoylglutathione lyase family enzyme